VAGRTLVFINKGMREAAMDWSTGLSWLAALKARRDERFVHTDLADMGTAYGLEASMLPAVDPQPEAPATPAEAGPQPWEHRIIRRSGL
jgi:hypothetical protein